jgi:hypothetical protein
MNTYFRESNGGNLSVKVTSKNVYTRFETKKGYKETRHSLEFLSSLKQSYSLEPCNYDVYLCAGNIQFAEKL